MKYSRTRTPDPREFVTSSLHYYPRIDKSFSVLLLGGIIFLLGCYLIANELPVTSSYLTQIVLQGIPATVGGILIIFGVVGLSTAWVGASRKGEESIDLKVKPSGITVRGGLKISWDSIVSATSVHHANDAKVQVLWDRADLNYSLDVYVDEALEIPRRKMKNGKQCVRIFLRHYPAVEYMRLYEATLDQFERRGIPVDTERTQTQF